jgi:hypothetical protein
VNFNAFVFSELRFEIFRNSAVHFVLGHRKALACFCELRLPVAAPHSTQGPPLRTQRNPPFFGGMREGISLSLLPLPNFARPDRTEPQG